MFLYLLNFFLVKFSCYKIVLSTVVFRNLGHIGNGPDGNLVVWGPQEAEYCFIRSTFFLCGVVAKFKSRKGKTKVETSLGKVQAHWSVLSEFTNVWVRSSCFRTPYNFRFSLPKSQICTSPLPCKLNRQGHVSWATSDRTRIQCSI